MVIDRREAAAWGLEDIAADKKTHWAGRGRRECVSPNALIYRLPALLESGINHVISLFYLFFTNLGLVVSVIKLYQGIAKLTALDRLSALSLLGLFMPVL